MKSLDISDHWSLSGDGVIICEGWRLHICEGLPNHALCAAVKSISTSDQLVYLTE